MKTLLFIVVLGAFALSTYAETGTWHRFKIYDIGSPRPAGQPHPLTVGR